MIPWEAMSVVTTKKMRLSHGETMEPAYLLPAEWTDDEEDDSYVEDSGDEDSDAIAIGEEHAYMSLEHFVLNAL